MSDNIDPLQMTEEQREQSKKRRKRYLAYIVLLVAIVAVVVAAAVFFIMNDRVEEKRQSDDVTLVEQADVQGESSVSAAPAAVADIPNIAALVGMPGDDAVSMFGSTVKAYADSSVEQEDSNVVTLRRIELNTALDKSDGSQTTSGATGKSNPAVSLSLDESGTVLGVYYTVDLYLLGIGNSLFSDTISDTSTLASYMTLAGIGTATSELHAPAENDVVVEQSTTSDGRTIPLRESYVFEGDADIEAIGEVRHWALSLEYDHALANSTGDATNVSRTLGIRISPPPYVAPELDEEEVEV